MLFSNRMCILFFFLTSIIFAQQSVTLVTYNLLNYSPGTSRDGYYRTIINEINPDLLVTQEMLSQNGADDFLSNVLNHSTNKYNAGDFIDGYDTDNAIYYKTASFDFISNIPIPTSLRDINEFKVVYLPTNDTIMIYSVHLKASQGGSNEQQRLTEINALRQVTDNLPLNSNFIICGDFNIYYSDEPAFQRLVDQSNPGYVADPINVTGYWHDNATFAQYHTQSTRTRQFGGGATGGLDDRFDMILISQAISDSGGIDYVNGSYISFGNDGLHFNDSINALPNIAVSDSVANALHYASDHLPVLLKLNFGICGLLGDVNADSVANSTDGLINLSYDAGLPMPAEILGLINIGFGDVNEDDVTNSTDVLIILSYDVGVQVVFPVGDSTCFP